MTVTSAGRGAAESREGVVTLANLSPPPHLGQAALKRTGMVGASRPQRGPMSSASQHPGHTVSHTSHPLHTCPSSRQGAGGGGGVRQAVETLIHSPQTHRDGTSKFCHQPSKKTEATCEKGESTWSTGQARLSLSLGLGLLEPQTLAWRWSAPQDTLVGSLG